MAKYPVYSRIGDEQVIQEAKTWRGLQWFERIDIDEIPHDAWDMAGRQFQLVWDPLNKLVVLKAISENGLVAFEAAVKRHIQWYEDNPRRKVAPHHCDLIRLHERKHRRAADEPQALRRHPRLAGCDAAG